MFIDHFLDIIKYLKRQFQKLKLLFSVYDIINCLQDEKYNANSFIEWFIAKYLNITAFKRIILQFNSAGSLMYLNKNMY